MNQSLEFLAQFMAASVGFIAWQPPPITCAADMPLGF